MKKAEIKRLIRSYINNILMDDDLIKLEKIIKDEDNWKYWRKTLDEMDIDEISDSGLDSISRYTLKKRIDLSINQKKRRYYGNNWLKIAASFIIISGLVWLGIQYANNLDQTSVSKLLEKNNPAGKKSTFYLPDGSRVQLNSESTLSYPSSFDGLSERVIELQGEAYFDVVSDKDHPFIVTSGNSSVKALGTAFNVNARNGMEVALVEGKVEVSFKKENANKVILTPGEMALSANRLIVKSKFNKESVLGWTEGNLVFVNASLNEVIDELEMWYGVEIEAEGFTNDDWGYDGEFKNEPLSIVLKSLSYAKGFEYTIDSSKIVMKNRS